MLSVVKFNQLYVVLQIGLTLQLKIIFSVQTIQKGHSDFYDQQPKAKYIPTLITFKRKKSYLRTGTAQCLAVLIEKLLKQLIDYPNS